MTNSKKPIEVITPPNMLKVKVGGKLPKFDEAAVARAEQALANLADQFQDWMAEELANLETAFASIQETGLDGEHGANFFRRVHDLKGMGATYEFPIVTRIAGCLCKLLEEPETRKDAPLSIVAAHVHAIKAAVRDDIRDDTHPVGRALAQELESQVLGHLDKAA